MPYLAMTAAELHACTSLPEKCGYMACHFSPYGTGLSNLPRQLPEGALLILNDRTPTSLHDPVLIRDTMEMLCGKFRCSGVLLDFQRPGCAKTAEIAGHLLTLPCPVCVSEIYARDLDCPVFLPPVPMLQTVEDYLQPWKSRTVWLEIALEALDITVTESGSQKSVHRFSPLVFPHRDEELCCHYAIEVSREKAVFQLQRTREDLQCLQERARNLGVARLVGLWQELGDP